MQPLSNWSIYDFPDVCDIIFQRPAEVVAVEVHSIAQLLAHHSMTGGRILELACGACPHSILLAQQGFAVTGLDRSTAMLKTAADRAAAARVTLDLVQGDIIDFNLNGKTFDAVIFMFETFPVITAYEDIVNHFRAVRGHLRSGGLYIIDLDARKHGVGTTTAEWGRQTLLLPNGSVEMWHEDLPGDWVQGTSHLVLHCRITIAGKVYETTDDWRLRVYSPWDLTVLVQTLAGWSLKGFFSWRDLSPDIGNERHYFMVLEACQF